MDIYSNGLKVMVLAHFDRIKTPKFYTSLENYGFLTVKAKQYLFDPAMRHIFRYTFAVIFFLFLRPWRITIYLKIVLSCLTCDLRHIWSSTVQGNPSQLCSIFLSLAQRVSLMAQLRHMYYSPKCPHGVLYLKSSQQHPITSEKSFKSKQGSLLSCFQRLPTINLVPLHIESQIRHQQQQLWDKRRFLFMLICMK